jgi:DNA-binding NarL/FixJ family response regulator
MTRVVFIDDTWVLLVESELNPPELVAAITAGSWKPPAALAGVLGPHTPRLRAVRLGRLVVVAPAAAPLEAHDPATAPEDLEARHPSPRQIEILQGVADGLTNKEIAQRLGISESSIQRHLNIIQAKFGTHSRMQSVLRGVALGYCKLNRK